MFSITLSQNLAARRRQVVALWVMFFFGLFFLVLTACSPTTGTAPTTTAATPPPQAGDMFEETVEVVRADPPYPLDFEGDMNDNALISGAVKYQDVDGGYGRLVSGITREGCLKMSDDALGRTVETIIDYADNVSLPDLCAGRTLTVLLNNSGLQFAQLSLRPNENGDDVLIAKLDGIEVFSAPVDGLLYAAEKVEATQAVPQWVTENAQLIVDIKTISGLSDLDLGFYSFNYEYAYPSGAATATYTETATIRESVFITDTVTSSVTGLDEERLVPDPTQMVTNTVTTTYEMPERVTITWPAISLTVKQEATNDANTVTITVGPGGSASSVASAAAQEGKDYDCVFNAVYPYQKGEVGNGWSADDQFSFPPGRCDAAPVVPEMP